MVYLIFAEKSKHRLCPHYEWRAKYGGSDVSMMSLVLTLYSSTAGMFKLPIFSP
jgi:hypothetical protein